MRQPTFSPMTLPLELYDAVCERVDQAFADSYLTGATLANRKLTPRTLTAYGKMRDSFEFKKLLSDAGIELVKPLPIHLQANPITREFIYRSVH